MANDPRYKVKVELKSLFLTDESTRKIQETLRFVRGEEFTHKSKDFYEDKNLRLDKQYWLDRGKLIVKGLNNASPTSVQTEAEQITKFAKAKLEKYGFVPKHCEEALGLTNGDVGLAYEFLMCRYFGCPPAENKSQVSQNLIEERNQELDSLRSIYGNWCEEKIPNQLWVIHLNLSYLGDICMKKPLRRNFRNTDKSICRYFLKGRCAFGPKCKFSHNVKNEAPPNMYVDENRNKFDLEIRFPTGNKYPLEAPLVSLVPGNPSFSPNSSLKITNKLMDVIRESMKLQQPSVHNLLELLNHRSEEVLACLNDQLPSVYALECIIPQNDVQEEVNGDHFYAPNLNKKKEEMSFETIQTLNEELIKRHYNAMSQPQYNKMIERRKSLPAWHKCKEILNAINSNQVVVIVGDTGCGKTTQVPQFILDDWIMNKRTQHTEIICTQPRRISAIGVSERVASERLDRLGHSVGYQIRLENRVSQYTRLMFCTTGILLRRLESDPLLKNITHVIVDEVHERSVESDFILLILKDMLITRPELKIILMSATINAEQFSSYFNGAPIVEIPGRTYPVEQLFLEDVVHKINYSLEEYSACSRNIGRQQSKEMDLLSEYDDPSEVPTSGMHIGDPKTQDDHLLAKQVYFRYRDYPIDVRRTMFLMDMKTINMDLIEKVLDWIAIGNHNYPRDGSILVFLPGIGEIKDMLGRLENNPIFSSGEGGSFLIIPLHSMLTSEEQTKIFKKPAHNQRKLVLATNIAETSITIDDCVFVIDCGRMKEKGFDSNKNMESLEMVWESQANAQQRKGRAGRVMPGVCFHLFSRQRFEHIMNEQPMPEICRVPLEQLVLRVKTLKALQHRNVYQVITELMEPPPKENVEGAVKRLIDVGALDEKIELTPLGKHLASLPVDVRIGKLILYGAMFCALDSALTMAAFLSFKSPFSAPMNKIELAEQKKKKFITSFSDHLTTLNAYNSWKKACERGTRSGFIFAKDNFMSQKTLSTLSEMKVQFLEYLIDIGFIPELDLGKKYHGDRVLEISGPELNANSNNHRVLSAILCAALYPNIVKIYSPTRSFTESITGAIPEVTKPEDLVLVTKQEGSVNLHPTSVNCSIGEFPSPYLVYQEKIKTSRIFIRDCTMVPVLPLVLFSAGAIKVELNNEQFFLSLDDGWLLFPVPSSQVAELLESMKEELLHLLDQKIKDPRINLLKHPNGKRIISTIVHLISDSY